VPGRILSVFVAELKLYGFRPIRGRFAELLSILEEAGATGLGEFPGASQTTVAITLAK
jgi:hypothetical protein